MEDNQWVECRGGWGFLILAVGVISLTPGCILLGIYADRSDETMFIVSLCIFCTSMLFTLVGSLITAYWCCVADLGKKDDQDKETLTSSQSKNGVQPSAFSMKASKYNPKDDYKADAGEQSAGSSC